MMNGHKNCQVKINSITKQIIYDNNELNAVIKMTGVKNCKDKTY